MTSRSLKLSFILPPLALATIYAFKMTILNSLFSYFHGRVVRETAENASTISKFFYDERDCVFVLSVVVAASVISFNFGMFMGGYLFDTVEILLWISQFALRYMIKCFCISRNCYRAHCIIDRRAMPFAFC
jgi:hypothetical protein